MLNLKDAELQGGQPCGVGGEAVAEHNLLWVRAGPEVNAVCARWEDLAQSTTEVGKLLRCSLHLDLHQDGIWHLHGLQRHLSHNTLWTWTTAWSPWRSRGEAALPVSPPFSARPPPPAPSETSETGLFFLGPFSLPCSPLLPWLWGFLLNYLVLSSFVKNLRLQKIKKKETV